MIEHFLLLFLCSNDVDPNFECKLEIYCHKQLDDFTIASTPKKLKKRMNELSNSFGRSVGKRLSGLVRENLPVHTGIFVGHKQQLLMFEV